MVHDGSVFDGCGIAIRVLITAWHGKISVQVNSSGVIALSQHKAIRIHHGADPDLSVVDQVCDPIIDPILRSQQLDQTNTHVVAHHFIAMN